MSKRGRGAQARRIRRSGDDATLVNIDVTVDDTSDWNDEDRTEITADVVALLNYPYRPNERRTQLQTERVVGAKIYVPDDDIPDTFDLRDGMGVELATRIRVTGRTFDTIYYHVNESNVVEFDCEVIQ